MILKSDPQAAVRYPMLADTYSYIRNDWEHLYSHYIYGTLDITTKKKD
jgi:hypothetical protein